jgi:predicted enzyme related to lactoylglutathione lyase
MADSKNCQFTNTMIRVESLEAAAKFWTGVMGMVETERSDYGIILEDPDSSQRITLVTTGFGSKYALAVATDDMRAMLDRLVNNGAEVQQPKKAESGAEYALCKGPSGISIMIYVAGANDESEPE